MIYLAGRMNGLSETEAMAWRKDFINSMSYVDSEAEIFCPPLFFSYNVSKVLSEEESVKYELECFKYETNKVKQSSVVVVSLDGIEKSLGTVQELAIAYDNHIPIIGIAKNEEVINNLHPWIKNELFRYFVGQSSIEDTAVYVYEYFCDRCNKVKYILDKINTFEGER